MKKEITVLVARSLLFLLFIYASVSKLVNIPQFKGQMFKQPFPHWMGYALMVIIPVAEIVVAVSLFFDKSARKALMGSIILMVLFTGYIIAILSNAFGRIPCSCGGIIEKFNWSQHLIFNFLFLSIAILGFVLIKNKKREANSNFRNIVVS